MTACRRCLTSTRVQHRIAIYDLDRTVLATPTFTAFLLFAARRDAKWRLALLPFWLIAMVGYAFKFYDRDTLKPMGISMLLGRRIKKDRMSALAIAFAHSRLPSDIQPGALAAMQRDRKDGYRLVLATAAPEFYACHLGESTGFEAVLASRHDRAPNGDWLARLSGRNCYGVEKRRRVEQWLDESGIARASAHIRFYSDDMSDAPTLEFADQGFAVNPDRRFARTANAQGWQILDFRNSSPDWEAS